MEKVGWIFTQSSKERDYIMNAEEICQMAAWQHELGEHCVTGVVSLSVSDEGSDVHFEAFQVFHATSYPYYLTLTLHLLHGLPGCAGTKGADTAIVKCQI